MDLKAIVDAIFADIEATVANRPFVVMALHMVNAIIDQFLTANPVGGPLTRAVTKQ